MKQILLLATLALMLHLPVLSQKVEVIKYDQLENLIREDFNGIKVINFWATWCKPCIKELPYFESINRDFADIKVVLVSFDDAEAVETRVEPFLKKRNIRAEVKLLDETDYNSFIDKVHESWSGAIPATLIVDRSGRKHFYEKEFSEEELRKTINEFIN